MAKKSESDQQKLDRLEELLKSKTYPLDDVIRKIFPELPDTWMDLIQQYKTIIETYGLPSQEAIDLYNLIIKEHKSMEGWLDSIAIDYFRKEYNLS